MTLHSISFRRLVWGLVVILSLVLGWLLLANPKAIENPQGALRGQAELERGQFERLSFWKELSSKNIPKSRVKRSLYDGLLLDADSEEIVVSVMVDNFSAARPQHTGIRSASIVYESLVEGGITRLMLIMPYQNLEKVGPVRSARDYFVDYAEEYGGIYMHAGGSPTALKRLSSSDRVLNMDEDDRDGPQKYSFRDKRYKAPHNLFVDLFSVREFAEGRSWKANKPLVKWCFRDRVTNDSAEPEDSLKSAGAQSAVEPIDLQLKKLVFVDKIDLNYSNDASSSYFVSFEYDPTLASYLRYYRKNNPQQHIDQADGKVVSPKNVIVQIAPSALIPGDAKERIRIEHIGRGKAFFFQNGKMRAGFWTKPSETQSTQFFEASGAALCLNSGQTWVAVLDDESLLQTSFEKNKL